MNINFEALVVGNGDFPNNPHVLELMNKIPYVVCCDGGANEYIHRGLIPDLIIGDGDSLSVDNQSQYAHLIHRIADRYDRKNVKYKLTEKGRSLNKILYEIAMVSVDGETYSDKIKNDVRATFKETLL